MAPRIYLDHTGTLKGPITPLLFLAHPQATTPYWSTYDPTTDEFGALCKANNQVFAEEVYDQSG